MAGLRNYWQTMDDVLRTFYSSEGSKFIQKADAPVLSTTTGVYNAVYGAEVWRQLNQADRTFGLLPKVPFNRSGWRVISARGDASTGSAITTPTGGQAENAALPDTQKPTFVEVSTKPKEVVHTFDVSTKQDYLARVAQDDAVGDLEFLRNYWGVEHKEQINAQLLVDVDTTANNNFESIDRVASSNAEVSDLTLDANDADIYGLDRDGGATWADAYVNSNGGTDRSLTDLLIRTTMQNVFTNGGEPTLWLTHYDTYSAIQGLYADQARYVNPMSEQRVVRNINGEETSDGTEVGLNVATIYGVPLFKDKQVTVDTIGRLFLLDTSNPEGFDYGRLHLAVARPTSYYESHDLFSIDKLGFEGLYFTSGELRCTFFAAQGKLRDLQT